MFSVERFFQFVDNHPILTGLLGLLVVGFVFFERRRGGRGVTSGEVVRLMNREGAVVLDVRSKEEYTQGHIAGAVNLPYSKFTEKGDDIKVKMEKYEDKTLIIVDSAGQHAGAVCGKFKEWGVPNVVKLIGGISGWRSENLPLV